MAVNESQGGAVSHNRLVRYAGAVEVAVLGLKRAQSGGKRVGSARVVDPHVGEVGIGASPGLVADVPDHASPGTVVQPGRCSYNTDNTRGKGGTLVDRFDVVGASGTH